MSQSEFKLINPTLTLAVTSSEAFKIQQLHHVEKVQHLGVWSGSFANHLKTAQLLHNNKDTNRPARNIRGKKREHSAAVTSACFTMFSSNGYRISRLSHSPLMTATVSNFSQILQALKTNKNLVF